MTLQSFGFLIFLAAVAVVHYRIPRRFQYIWLCLASLFFYLSGDIHYLAGLAICAASTYGAGLLLGRERGRGKKALVALCTGVQILLLLLFRYPLAKSVFVPLGLSFYALQAMGYVIEVYRGSMRPEKNPLRYMVYVTFFPTVMSGPIQRAPELLPQIREGKDFDYDRVHSGLYLLLWGFLLKQVLANPLGSMVDYAYGNYAEMPGATLLWATVLYAVQLYCDFAGYSALAMGAAGVLGFEISENFRQPYFAVSVRDFWKRWHISLSSWLRDYVYIPLGGNRRGKCRQYGNLMATFLISGLWHGSGAHYLAWGAIHGVCQVLESGISHRHRGPGLPAPTNAGRMENPGVCRARRIVRGMGVFALVDFAWLFFRAESLEQAFAILYRIFFCFRFKEMTYYGSYLMGRTKTELLLLLLGIVLMFLVDFLHEKKISIERYAARRLPSGVRWAAYIVLTLGILLVVAREYGQGASNFIYTRF